MKFYLAGSTSFAWAELLKEFPPEHLTALNTHRINVQSINGFLRLLKAFDTSSSIDLSLKIEIPPYILELWSVSWWFELPFTVIEELVNKTRIRTLNVPQSRSDCNKGLLIGTLGAWRELCLLRGKPYVSSELTNLITLVISFFERENLSYLLN